MSKNAFRNVTVMSFEPNFLAIELLRKYVMVCHADFFLEPYIISYQTHITTVSSTPPTPLFPNNPYVETGPDLIAGVKLSFLDNLKGGVFKERG